MAKLIYQAIRTLRKTTLYILGTILGIYIGAIILLNIPYVQQRMTVWVAGELSDLLETDVTIGRINPGLFNRIIIDDILIEDRSGKEMVKISRLSAKYDILPLFNGKISIGSVQLFGFDINLNKPTPGSEPNFQFMIDAFASNDTLKTKSNIDLRINSFLIRRGELAYDVLSEPVTPGKFNPMHVKLYNIIGNISLKALRADSINAQVRRFSADEQSGFELRKLNLKLLGNNSNMVVEDFTVDLPGTTLRMDDIQMTYDSLGAFSNFMTDVHFTFKILPSYVTPQDVSPFVPALSHFKDKLDLQLSAEGTIDQLHCSRVAIDAGSSLRLLGNVSFQDLSNPQDAYVFGKLNYLSANTDGLKFLARNFSDNGNTPSSAIFSQLHQVSFNGEISGYFTDLVLYGNFNTNLGLVKGDVKISSDKEKGTLSYSGGIETEDFEFGHLLDNPKWGNVSFNLELQSTFYKTGFPHVVMKGLVASIEYSNYQYRNITLDGEYKHGGFNGQVSVDNENGSVYLNGDINMNREIPAFNFHAGIKNIDLHALNLTRKYQDTKISLNLNANFTGSSIGDMIGEINVDSLLFVAPDRKYFLDNLNVLSTQRNGNKQLALKSPFMKANIAGDYSYKDLPNSLKKIARQYLPTLFADDAKALASTNNNFTFDIELYCTEILPIIFDVPLSIYAQSSIRGYINDTSHRMKIEGYFPQMNYGTTFIESGMVSCESSADMFRGRVRFSNYRKNSIVNFSFDTQAQNDELLTRLNWGNNTEKTYSGHVEATTKFLRGEDKATPLQTVIDIKPTNVILNDTLWQVHPSRIVADSEKIHIDNFNFSCGDQFLRINGYAANDMSHGLEVNLKDISISYIFDIFNLRNINFDGNATGYVNIYSALKNPVMETKLAVKGFKFNNALLGDMNVYGEWDNQQKGIYLDAKIRDKEVAETDVKGYIYPLKPKSGLDLNIKAKDTNLHFLEHYVSSFASNVKGEGSGNVHLYGGFSSLNLEGRMLADASFKVNVLNTQFALRDSIVLSPTGITLRNAAFYDMEKHTGVVDGYLRYKHFKGMNYRFNVNVNNMLVMNTSESPDMSFYGTVYATGNGVLSGNVDALNIDAAMSTNRNTNFVYSMAPASSATSNQFIKFVDKTHSRNFADSIQLVSDFELAQQQKQLYDEEESDLDVRLNVQVDATPDASVRIIMDPIAGDYIQASGNGNMRIEFYNKGEMKMFGNYVISQGIYKFSLQEVIRKDFAIRDGSNITFSGGLSGATMDVQAAYIVNSASLTDLAISSDMVPNTNVRVSCLMNLSGSLENPDIRLAIELPNEPDEVQAMVRNYISTDEDVNMQMLYLLAIGKFYTPDYVNATQNSNMMTSVLSSTLSGQLNNMLSQIISSNNWNIGTNLSTGDKGWTDVEVEGILSGRLLNNRLLINGNFGYRENPLSNTNFVGDFEAEWLLNRSGDIRLKAYNQTNDKYYIRTNLTTQGIGIMFKKDFNRWGDLFFWRRKDTKSVPEEKQEGTEQKE